jgi:hypothetical protein
MSKIPEVAILKSLLVKPKMATRMNFKADCPYCGKEGHFYINYTNGKNDCKKCGTEGNIITFLNAVSRLDLIDDNDIDIRVDKLARLTDGEEMVADELIMEIPTIKMPICSEAVHYGDNSIFDKYLRKRKFKQIDYQLYEPMFNNVVDRLKDYVIIKVLRDYLCKGYVARYVAENKDAMRYINSTSEFSKLLFGYDEISNKTEVLVLTEGVFDKIGVTTEFELHLDDQMKCLCTFGKKVSEAQIRLIKKTNVKKIILLHDGRDAINEMKKNSFKLKEHGFKVEVGYMPDKDPADSTQQELIDVFSNLLTPEEFWLNKLQIR